MSQVEHFNTPRVLACPPNIRNEKYTRNAPKAHMRIASGSQAQESILKAVFL